MDTNAVINTIVAVLSILVLVKLFIGFGKIARRHKVLSSYKRGIAFRSMGDKQPNSSSTIECLRWVTTALLQHFDQDLVLKTIRQTTIHWVDSPTVLKWEEIGNLEYAVRYHDDARQTALTDILIHAVNKTFNQNLSDEQIHDIATKIEEAYPKDFYTPSPARRAINSHA